MDAADTTLLGRGTYEGFASFWPTQSDDFPIARATNSISKHLVSTTVSDADASWGDTTVLRNDAVQDVTGLKKKYDVNGIHGSTELVRTLLDAGLIDELRITLDPVIIGAGKRLFTDDCGLLIWCSSPPPPTPWASCR